MLPKILVATGIKMEGLILFFICILIIGYNIYFIKKNKDVSEKKIEVKLAFIGTPLTLLLLIYSVIYLYKNW